MGQGCCVVIWSTLLTPSPVPMLPCGAGTRQPQLLASSTHRLGHLVPDPADPIHSRAASSAAKRAGSQPSAAAVQPTLGFPRLFLEAP